MPDPITPEQLEAAGLDHAAAATLAAAVNSTAALPPAERWATVTREQLRPDQPFPVHLAVYDAVFAEWDPADGPRPAWTPAPDTVAQTNIGQLMAELDLTTYQALHEWAGTNRAEFWDRMIRKLEIPFREPYTAVLDLSDGVARPNWLPGAKFNIADSCFLAPPDSTAVIYQPEGGAPARLTYAQLEAMTRRVAHGLAQAGFGPGDALACYMPMTVESVAIYLGLVRAGCVVVSVADSFAPAEVAKRLTIAGAKGIFTQDVLARAGKQLPLYEKVRAANAPRAIVLPADPSAGMQVELRPGDLAWDAFLGADRPFESVACAAGAHTNILFSSGTTGDPKAIPWTQTTPLKCAVDGHLHQNIQPGDVVAWPTNLGWMMGPWLIYAGLVNRAAIALFHGAPTGRPFTTFVQDARVTMLGVVPSLVKAWRADDCIEGLDWHAIKAFSSTGECSNAEDMLFLMSRAGYKPVIEYCGGTELAGGYITCSMAQPASPATFSTPALGLDFVLLDENGHATDNGEVALVPPSIGFSNELLNRDHDEVYFKDMPAGPNGEVLRRHGDQIERLPGGHYRAHGRVDDTMNLGGIKVSSTEIERTVNALEGVRETAAIAVADQAGGPQRLVVYVVLEPGANLAKDELHAAMQREIKANLNPLFRIHALVILESLPRTASNKVMRRKLRAAFAESPNRDGG